MNSFFPLSLIVSLYFVGQSTTTTTDSFIRSVGRSVLFFRYQRFSFLRLTHTPTNTENVLHITILIRFTKALDMWREKKINSTSAWISYEKWLEKSIVIRIFFFFFLLLWISINEQARVFNMNCHGRREQTQFRFIYLIFFIFPFYLTFFTHNIELCVLSLRITNLLFRWALDKVEKNPQFVVPWICVYYSNNSSTQKRHFMHIIFRVCQW